MIRLHRIGLALVVAFFAAAQPEIPHFYNGYCVFQYATSIAASALFFERGLANEPGARARATCSGCAPAAPTIPTSSCDALGLIPPSRRTIARMNAVMDRIEAILVRRG